MSNKPKGWKALPYKFVSVWDKYCHRVRKNAINVLKRKNNSKHQGSKPFGTMLAALHANDHE